VSFLDAASLVLLSFLEAAAPSDVVTSLTSSLFTVVLSGAVAFIFVSSFVALELLDVSSDDELFCSDFVSDAFVSDSNDDEELVASNIGD